MIIIFQLPIKFLNKFYLNLFESFIYDPNFFSIFNLTGKNILKEIKVILIIFPPARFYLKFICKFPANL